MLSDLLGDERGSSLQEAATSMFRTMLDLLEKLNDKISDLASLIHDGSAVERSALVLTRAA
jgi:hypothetical protein